MPFSAALVWSLTSIRRRSGCSKAVGRTPSTVWNPDRVMFAVVATRTGALIASDDEVPATRSVTVLMAPHLSSSHVGPWLLFEPEPIVQSVGAPELGSVRP